MFSCEFSEISKNTFFTEHLRTTASAFSFSEAATRGVLWKKVLLKISQNSWKNTCGLWNFKEHLFFTEHLWMTVSGFSLQLYKNWELATLLGKPQMNTLYLETLTLEVPFRYIISLFAAYKLWVYVFIGLHCLLPEAATRVEVLYKKGCS